MGRGPTRTEHSAGGVLGAAADRPAAGPRRLRAGPGVLLKTPGGFLKDPGGVFKDPGGVFKDPGGVFKGPRGGFSKTPGGFLKTPRGVKIKIFILGFWRIPGRTWPRDPLKRVGPEKWCRSHPKQAPETNSKAVSRPFSIFLGA